MNSGIADAAGLSWVLAACVQGWGDESLPDAYDAERRPTAWWHLEAARRHMGVRLAIGQLSAEPGDLECSGPEGDHQRHELAANTPARGEAEKERWGDRMVYDSHRKEEE